MLRPSIVTAVLATAAVACSSDESPTVSVTVTLSGDVVGTDPASIVYLCEPAGEVDQFLSFMASPTSPVTYSFLFVVRQPRVFAPGLLRLDDLYRTSILSATRGTTRYLARAEPTHSADEQVALTIDRVFQPGAEPCTGSVTGTLDMQLVEIIDGVGGAPATIGPGRITAHLVAE